MSDTHLEVEASASDDTLTITLRGEVDAYTASQLDGEIESGLFTSTATILELDFGGVTFLDSSGLRVVISAHRRMRERKGRLIVHRPSPTVQRLLEITQLTEELEIT